MGRIVTTTEDRAVYVAIADLAHTAATPEEIDANSLFRAAEDYIISLLPAAALPGGRTHAQRGVITGALEFCAAYYMVSGGGKIATKGETTTTGPVRSRTQRIGVVEVSETYHEGGTRTVNTQTQTVDVRLDFLKEQCDAFLKQLGIAPLPTPTHVPRFYVGKTRSRKKCPQSSSDPRCPERDITYAKEF